MYGGGFMVYPSMIGTHDVNNINVLRKIQKRREMVMSNDLLISCINKTCNISTGSMGSTYSKVVILEVNENWIKVEKNVSSWL